MSGARAREAEPAGLSVRSGGPEATERLGARLGALLRPGDLLRLRGELGAGKTTFSRGVGRGLGLADALSSPTYLLCKEYLGPGGPVLHLDGYFAARLDSLLGEGLVERLDDRAVVLVEWPEHVAAWLPAEGLDLDLLPGPTEEERRLRFTAHGPRAAARLAEFARNLAEAGISVEPEAPEAR